MKFTDPTELAQVLSDLHAEAPHLRDLVQNPTTSTAWVGGSVFYGFLENA